MGAQLEVEVDFGTGATQAVANITGQATIIVTSDCEAWVMGATTTDHNADEHLIADFRCECGIPTAGVGYPIYVFCDNGTQKGLWKIQTVWN